MCLTMCTSVHVPATSQRILTHCPQAIRTAAGWGADIISMSFGYAEDVTIIGEALRDAEILRGNKILFFAAANNDGLNQPEKFPAFSESVISVRGTAQNGKFIRDYNPKNWPHKPGIQYGTLAKDVPCGFFPVKSGCSVATPILAAIAAVIIAFVDRDAEFDEWNRDTVRTRRGMRSVLQFMANDQNSKSERLYIAPWFLFEYSARPRTLISYALDRVPRNS